jgi:hypothetical protein
MDTAVERDERPPLDYCESALSSVGGVRDADTSFLSSRSLARRGREDKNKDKKDSHNTFKRGDQAEKMGRALRGHRSLSLSVTHAHYLSLSLSLPLIICGRKGKEKNKKKKRGGRGKKGKEKKNTLIF